MLYTVNTLNKCRERGILLVFATARPMSMVSPFADEIKPDALLLSNGAIIWVGGKVVKEHVLPRERANAMLRELAESGKTYKISARGRKSYYTSLPNADEDAHTMYDFKAPICEEIVHFSFRTEDKAFAFDIIKKYPEFQHFCFSGDNLYDIGLLGATKANGLRHLSELLNIPLANIAAFGGDMNDMEMLKIAGIGVAMGNAIPEVKAAADYICGDCDDDGAAKWLGAALYV